MMRDRGNIIFGFTLTEMLVAMAIMTILMAVAVPTARKLSDSMEQSTGVISIIDAALSNARAIAVREQKYAGVRFQMDNVGKTYLVLIINEGTGLADGYRVVDGRKPMMLPENTGVMDGMWVTRTYNAGTGELKNAVDKSLTNDLLNDSIAANMTDGKNRYFWDASTFSIVFSPSGKLINQQVRVCNKDGITDTAGKKNDGSMDNAFNKKDVVDGKRIAYVDTNGTVKERNVMTGDVVNPPLFYQDDYGGIAVLGDGKNYGIGAENSRDNFIIYDKRELKKFAPSNCLGYLATLNSERISPYTGELIKKN